MVCFYRDNNRKEKIKTKIQSQQSTRTSLQSIYDFIKRNNEKNKQEKKKKKKTQYF